MSDVVGVGVNYIVCMTFVRSLANVHIDIYNKCRIIIMSPIANHIGRNTIRHTPFTIHIHMKFERGMQVDVSKRFLSFVSHTRSL